MVSETNPAGLSSLATVFPIEYKNEWHLAVTSSNITKISNYDDIDQIPISPVIESLTQSMYKRQTDRGKERERERERDILADST